MKKVAIVGFGFMGKTHYGAWKKCRGAKVVAVCDNNLAQLTAKVVGNIKGAADNSSLPKSVRVWADFGEMLAAGGIDIVDITLPTPLHPRMTVAALEAGCNVLCEKPMALTLKDCDAMLAAERKSGRKLLVAQCCRFDPAYAYVRRLVKDRTYGKTIAAEFTRFMAAPKWSPKGGSWLLDETKSGGLYVDAHVHDADLVRFIFGEPKRAVSRGHRSAHGYTDHTVTRYEYADGKLVTAASSFAAASSLVFDAAARFFFEGATVYLGGAYRSPLTVYPDGGKAFQPKLPKLSGYEAEVRYFLDLVEGRVRPKDAVLTAGDARASIALVLNERAQARGSRSIPATSISRTAARTFWT